VESCYLKENFDNSTFKTANAIATLLLDLGPDDDAQDKKCTTLDSRQF